MADTSLGRASLSVTADLTDYFKNLNEATTKATGLTAAQSMMTSSLDKFTTAAQEQRKALYELHEAKIAGLESKLAMQSMQVLSAGFVGLIAKETELGNQLDLTARKLKLEAQQMLLDCGATKKLYEEMAILEEQELALAAAQDALKPVKFVESPPPVIEPPKVDTNTPQYVQEQMNLRSETDLASKALELQARQMNVDSGATKALHDEMAKLAEQERKLIELENKARGIPPPLPPEPPPIPVTAKSNFNSMNTDKNFRNIALAADKAASSEKYFASQTNLVIAQMRTMDKESIKLATNQKNSNTAMDLAARKLDLETRSLNNSTGATKRFNDELKKLEAQEKRIVAEENKIRGIRAATAAPKTQEVSISKGSLLGGSFLTAGFTKVFDGIQAGISGAIKGFVNLGTSIIEAGSKFEKVNARLKGLTGSDQIGKALQDIMKAGPSASFESLAEGATRLATLKFNPDAIAMLTRNFNTLGVALGDPERIMALIVDKIADMATEGMATTAAMQKLQDEGINVFEALAKRMTRTTGALVTTAQATQMVADGLVSVNQATQAISDAAGLKPIADANAAAAATFSGTWTRVSNNVVVLMQEVGTSILKGFGLVNLNLSITDFFENISIKIKSLEPFFMSIGAFASSASKVVMESISEFLGDWKIASEEISVEDLVNSAKLAAEQFVESLKPALETIKKVIGYIELIPRAVEAPAGAARWIQDSILDPISNGAAGLVTWTLGLNDAANGVVNLGNNIENLTKEIEGLDSAFTGAGASFGEMDGLLGANGGGFFDERADSAQGFADMMQEIEDRARSANEMVEDFMGASLRSERPPWEKFLAENLTPLQIYENEIKKLNLMLDGSAEGARAFAMGGASALEKLKSATGLGGPTQYASAITKGSAEDFKATLEAQEKRVDVQTQIKQIMEAANEIQMQQLKEQQAIAAAIIAQGKPRNLIVAMGN